MTWQNDLLQSALAEFPPSTRPQRSAPAQVFTAPDDDYEPLERGGDCPAYVPQKPMTRRDRLCHFALIFALFGVPALIIIVPLLAGWLWRDGWR